MFVKFRVSAYYSNQSKEISTLIARTKGTDTRKRSNDSTSAISRWYPRHIHDLTHIGQPGSVAMSWSEVPCHRTDDGRSAHSLLILFYFVLRECAELVGYRRSLDCLQLQDVDLAQETTGLGADCSLRSKILANKEQQSIQEKTFLMCVIMFYVDVDPTPYIT